MTDDQTKQVETLLKALAEAKCPLAVTSPGLKLSDCPNCNGTGLDPRLEMFRAGCKFGRKNCDLCDIRPLTPAEAEALIGKMLELEKWRLWWHGDLGWVCCNASATSKWCNGATPLLAILSAVCSAVGVEVTGS